VDGVRWIIVICNAGPLTNPRIIKSTMASILDLCRSSLMPSTHFTLFFLFFLSSIFVPIFATAEQGPDCLDRRGQRVCKNLHQRQEWYDFEYFKTQFSRLNFLRRTLTDTQKGEYIKAVKCLHSHPAKEPVFAEAKSRFDEFQAYHIQQADSVHLVVSLLRMHFDSTVLTGF
jgi:hypothetical protein